MRPRADYLMLTLSRAEQHFWRASGGDDEATLSSDSLPGRDSDTGPPPLPGTSLFPGGHVLHDNR